MITNLEQLRAALIQHARTEQVLREQQPQARWQQAIAKITGTSETLRDLSPLSAHHRNNLPPTTFEERLADDMIQDEWERELRRITPAGSRWHPRLDPLRDQILPVAVAAA